MHWKTEIHSLWEKKKNCLQHNKHQLIDPDFVSFGQAFNTELYGSETLKYGSRFFLMAIKTVEKKLGKFFKPNIGYNSALSSPVNLRLKKKKKLNLNLWYKHQIKAKTLSLTRKDTKNIIAFNAQNQFD